MKPETVGITQVSRRRTPGLRREEVAELAGVGTTWYTWLEQARDIQPSAEVLRRLSSALKMNGAETRHLFALAGKAAPADLDGIVETPPASLVRFIEESVQAPAILIGLRWDVLAMNARAALTFPWMREIAERRSNLMEYFFCEFERKIMPGWDDVARRSVAEFRSTLSDSLDHPWILESIESLRRKSADFDRMWKEHEVFEPVPTIVETVVEGVSRKYERILLQTSDDSRHKIFVFNAVP